MARRIFIGDIQGCREQLDHLLERLALTSSDRLYVVGDLVNRGPDNVGVLRRIRERDATIVLGNHDLHLLRVAAGSRPLRKSDTIEDVLQSPDRDELLAWLGEHGVLHLEDDLVMVHAGLRPSWTRLATVARRLHARLSDYIAGENDEEIDFAVRVRYCDERGRRAEDDDTHPGPPFVAWDTLYRGRRTVVFGHWSRRGLVREPRRRGLDTGCVWGGRLTAWIAEEDRFVDVPGLGAR